jgi:hypothetical protein
MMRVRVISAPPVRWRRQIKGSRHGRAQACLPLPPWPLELAHGPERRVGPLRVDIVVVEFGCN